MGRFSFFHILSRLPNKNSEVYKSVEDKVVWELWAGVVSDKMKSGTLHINRKYWLWPK